MGLMQEKLWEAFCAGFLASGEGLNGECGHAGGKGGGGRSSWDSDGPTPEELKEALWSQFEEWKREVTG